MKLVGISGSPRQGGNTEICIDEVLLTARAEGVETTHLKLNQHNLLGGCRACGGCANTRNGTCPGVADGIDDLLKIVYSADGIVAGSPVYFGSATPELLGFLHRMGYIARRMTESPLAGKVFAGLAVGRRAGHNLVLNQIQNVAGPLNMTIAGSNYWPVAFAGPIGAVREDKEGMETMRILGANLARLIKSNKKG